MPWTEDFHFTHDKPRRVQVRGISTEKGVSQDTCNNALERLVKICQGKDMFNLNSEEYEEFAIVGVDYPARIFRYAAPLFGVVGQGAHLTAYVRTSAGIKIWVARQSPTISTYPNKLDSTVAGGVTAGTTLFETIIREAGEEASFSADFTQKNILSTGVLTYMTLLEESQGTAGGLVKPDMVYVYDMEVAENIIPKPHDDEVKDFYLMTPDDVKEALMKKEFKTNSAAVMIDFFIRHGFITADDERDYTEMSMHLHRTLPFATAPRL